MTLRDEIISIIDDLAMIEIEGDRDPVLSLPSGESAADAIKALIDRAVAAERERCAKVAENTFSLDNVIWNSRGRPYRPGETAIYFAERIAAAIRAPAAPVVAPAAAEGGHNG